MWRECVKVDDFSHWRQKFQLLRVYANELACADLVITIM